MSQENLKTVKLIYKIVFGLTTLAVAFLLILQVLDIYFNGGQSPFTQAAIARHFNQISPVIYVWLGLIMVGFILYEIFPSPKKIGKSDDIYAFNCLKKRLKNKDFEDSDEVAQYKKNQLLIATVKFSCGVCLCICAVFSLAYLLDGNNFKNYEDVQEVLQAAFYLLPFLLGAFILCVGVWLFEKAIVKKQLPIAKKLLKTAATDSAVSLSGFENFKNKITNFFERQSTVNSIRLAVAAVGVSFFVYGLATGGSAGVLVKAIAICRQCIGLG